MEDNFFFSEFIQGMGSLAFAILVVSALFIIVYVHFRLKEESESRYLLKSMAVGFTFIALLTLQRLFVKWPFGMNQDVYLFLTTGYVIQLFLPIQIYFIQKGHGILHRYRQVIILTGGIFIVNTIMLHSAPFLAVGFMTALRYFLQSLMIFILIYHSSIMYKAYKEAITSQNQEFFSFILDVFIFVVSSAFLIVLFGAMFTNISIYKTESLKIVLFVINIILIIKNIYYCSSSEGAGIEMTTMMNKVSYREESDGSGKFDELKERLLDYFESEKPFLDSKINISQVSLYLYSNKTYLSRLINEDFKSNFNQFVNYYRVEEAKKIFKANTKLSIQQLCDLSGFGSSATFTMAFRIYSGKTPADWCREYKIKSNNGSKDIQ